MNNYLLTNYNKLIWRGFYSNYEYDLEKSICLNAESILLKIVVKWIDMKNCINLNRSNCNAHPCPTDVSIKLFTSAHVSPPSGAFEVPAYSILLKKIANINENFSITLKESSYLWFIIQFLATQSRHTNKANRTNANLKSTFTHNTCIRRRTLWNSAQDLINIL